MTLLIIGLALCVLGVTLFVVGGFANVNSVAKRGSFSRGTLLIPAGWLTNIVGGVLAIIGLAQIVIDLGQGFQ